MIESWFPRNYELAEGVLLKTVLFAGGNWQIFSSNDDASVLIVRESLAQFWFSSELLDSSVLKPLMLGNDSYFYFVSPSQMILAPVSFQREFVTYEDGKSFALALASSRKILPNASFSEGVFVEQITRLLPGTNELMHEPDDILLGRWLSRGTEVSAGSVQLMQKLFPAVTPKGLDDILKTAHIAPNTAVKKNNDDFNNHKDDVIQKKKEIFELPGRSELETFFREYIIDIVQNPDDYKNMGIDFPSAFILQGPPGCGKTYAVEQLVEYLDWPCFFVDSTSIGSPYIHETSKRISAIF